jgi:hypothetical protein
MKLRSTSFLNFADLYESGGITFFDTPDFPDFPVADTDRYVEVDSQYLGRLDLMSYDQYDDVELWWVIALVNDINTIEDMFIGQKLRVPSIANVREYLKKA